MITSLKNIAHITVLMLQKGVYPWEFVVDWDSLEAMSTKSYSNLRTSGEITSLDVLTSDGMTFKMPHIGRYCSEL